MPNRTIPGDDSLFSRLIDRWQREQRTMSKPEISGFAEVVEGWTCTEDIVE